MNVWSSDQLLGDGIMENFSINFWFMYMLEMPTVNKCSVIGKAIEEGEIKYSCSIILFSIIFTHGKYFVESPLRC